MENFLQLSLILSAASFLQCLAGFGFSLLALPLMLLTGRPLVNAVVICVICSAAQKLIAVFVLKTHIDFKILKTLFICGIIGITLGVFVLYKMSFVSPEIIKKIVAVMVLSILLLRTALKIPPKEKIHYLWGWFAALLSGLLCGFANIGGPPMVIWTLSHKWSAEKTRGMVLAFVTILVPVQLAMLYIAFGQNALQSAINAGPYLPMVIIATIAGMITAAKLKVNAVRILMNCLLIVVSLVSLVF